MQSTAQHIHLACRLGAAQLHALLLSPNPHVQSILLMPTPPFNPLPSPSSSPPPPAPAVRSNPEGTLCGAPIHFILKFPTDYPQKQPEVRLLQALPHPNVTRAEGVQVLGVTAPPPGSSGSSGSLAQHRSRPLPREARYRLALWDCIPGHNSWSSAYSVLSVLLQLQGGYI